MPREYKRVVLLTGASGTLGAEFCRRFSTQYRIAAVHHSQDLQVPSQYRWDFNPTSGSARDAGPADGSVFGIRADLGHEHEIRRVVELTLAHFGHIDALVNCASLKILGPLLGDDRPIESLGAQLKINVYVPLRLASEIVAMCWQRDPRANRRLRRSITNVSSVSATNIYQGQATYSLSKAALNSLTMHMSQEYESIGIRANILSPNSFPAIVSTAAVAKELAQLIESSTTGENRVVGLEQ